MATKSRPSVVSFLITLLIQSLQSRAPACALNAADHIRSSPPIDEDVPSRLPLQLLNFFRDLSLEQRRVPTVCMRAPYSRHRRKASPTSSATRLRRRVI